MEEIAENVVSEKEEAMIYSQGDDFLVCVLEYAAVTLSSIECFFRYHKSRLSKNRPSRSGFSADS